MVHFKYLKYFLSNETHIDTFYVIFKTFFNFPGFTGNDVIIPEKLDIFTGTSTQIIHIGPRNNCANFHAFSTMRMIFHHSPTLGALLSDVRQTYQDGDRTNHQGPVCGKTEQKIR